MKDSMRDDTTADVLAMQRQILHRIGSAGRLAMMFELSDNLRLLVAAGVRHRHPQWDDRAVERDVIRLMIGEDLFRQAYGKGPAAT
jgi:hypothetical protein